MHYLIKSQTNFFFYFQDEYNNHTGLDLTGRVIAKIKSPNEQDIEIPQFQGKVSTVEFPLENGSAEIVSVTEINSSMNSVSNKAYFPAVLKLSYTSFCSVEI